MASSYYFLVAGLPDISLDEGKNVPSFTDFIAETEEQVTGTDRKLLKLIRLPFDNDNLISILENKTDFDPKGNFSRDTLTSSIKNPEILPKYMQLFLESYKENRQVFPGLINRDQLNWFFFDEVIANNNAFIKEWFTFELNLRNLVAGINSRKGLKHFDELATERDKAVSTMIIGRNDVAELILRSNAPDFGLSSILPWTEKVLAISRGNLLEMEKGLDSLRWEMLNDLTTFSYFGIEKVLAFSIKLAIVERWKVLDPKTGRERLEMLAEELRAGFEMPVAF
ncbi:MAG: DUF2764 family protein [Fibrobacter sp.]|nr:DUF2764 family protein [Fibrobacter sp.]